MKLTYNADLSQHKRLYLLKESCSALKFCQDYYDRSIDVDRDMFHDFTNNYMVIAPPPTPSEQSLLDKTMEHLLIKDERFKRIAGSLAAFPSVEVFQLHNEGDNAAWGKCVGVIDEAADCVLAYFWKCNSLERLNNHFKQNRDDTKREVNEIPNSRSLTLFVVAKFPYPFVDRSYDNILHVWDKIRVRGREAYILGLSNKNRDAIERDSTAGYVKATIEAVYLIESLAPRISRVTFVGQSDVAGSIPSWLMTKMITYSFELQLEAQNKYSRSFKTVDKVSCAT